jgi:histone H3/H4
MVSRKRGGKLAASTPTTSSSVPQRRSRNLRSALETATLQLSEDESSAEENVENENSGGGNQSEAAVRKEEEEIASDESDESEENSEEEEDVNEDTENVEPPRTHSPPRARVRRGKIPYKKAGLTMSCRKIEKIVKNMGVKKISRDAVVYLTGVVEYINSEILELAENEAIAQKKTRINHRHIMLAVKKDPALNSARCWKGTFSMAGVVPSKI